MNLSLALQLRTLALAAEAAGKVKPGEVWPDWLFRDSNSDCPGWFRGIGPDEMLLDDEADALVFRAGLVWLTRRHTVTMWIRLGDGGTNIGACHAPDPTDAVILACVAELERMAP